MAVATTETRNPTGLDEPRPIVTGRPRADWVFRATCIGAGVGTLAIMGLIGVFLAWQAWPALSARGLAFFTTTAFRPEDASSEFGIALLLYYTVAIAVIALVIAVPVGIASALFVNEYAPPALAKPLTALVDLLAAIPSLIYGLWGLFFLQPHLMGVSEFLDTHLGFIPIFDVQGGRYANSTFIAGVVVSLMVLPITTSVMRQVFSQTPPTEKEGALALGATRWGMIRAVVLPFGRGGIIGGSMLGLGRALGETIAVAIIISPAQEIHGRILEQGSRSIASEIALAWTESNDFGLSALLAAGLVLFVVTLLVNLGASVIVSRSRSGSGVDL